MQDTECIKRLTCDGQHIRLAGTQGDQGAVAVVGDADNSLSMRRVKSGSRGCMNQAAGGGSGWHCTATGGIGGVEKD